MSVPSSLLQLLKRANRVRHLRLFLPFVFLSLVAFQIFDIHHGGLASQLSFKVKKKIILGTNFYGYSTWNLTGLADDSSPSSPSIFKRLKCPISSCSLHFSPFDPYASQHTDAAAVIFHARDLPSPSSSLPLKHPSQKWIFLTLETPFHTGLSLSPHSSLLKLIDWTSTYTSDSDIPARYGRYEKSPTNQETETPLQKFVDSFMLRKGLVAHLVSNCRTSNNRHRYSNALRKYLIRSSSSTDNYLLFGNYGKCPMWRSKPIPCSLTDGRCLKNITSDYKFLLTFENSLCRQYITEKFWWNALHHGIIPVVMGGSKSDYEQFAPPHSFIHVDEFNSSRNLADYLIQLSKQPDEVAKYFSWQNRGRATSLVQGTDLNTSPYWCDLCAALHDPHSPKKQEKDIAQWWSVEEQCPNRGKVSWSDLRTFENLTRTSSLLS